MMGFGLQMVLRVLGNLMYAVLVSCLGNYVYGQLEKAFTYPPSFAGRTVIERPLAGRLGSDLNPRIDPHTTPPPPPPPPPKEVITLSDGNKADVYNHFCKLPDGQSFNFRIVVFSDAYSWVWNRSDQIELNKEKFLEGYDFIELVQRSAGLKNILNKARGIIVTGTASCDGSDSENDGSDPEDARALGRSGALKRWVQNAILPMNPDGPPRRVHRLNLGRYWPDKDSGQSCDPNHENTTYQRQVILMAVTESASDNAFLDTCIQQSLSRDNQLRPLLSHYRRFDLNKGLHGEPL